jgi:hypothetical protein
MSNGRAALVEASEAKSAETKDVLTRRVSEIIIVPLTLVAETDDYGASRREMPQTRRRIDMRYDFPATIEYVTGSQSNDEIVHKGIIINLSSTGLGMYIFDLLPNGQQITIKSTLPIDSRTATICWTRKKDENFYRSGLKFT